MKRIFFCALVTAMQAHAALTAAVQWDVRTTGNNNNGGGFAAGASGTDFSQQDAAQQTYTDLLIGGTTTQLTSAAHPFDATAPGNLIFIASGAGCTPGRYQVISQAAGVVTMDRSVGSAASICTGALGGALQTINAASINAVFGNTINIKTGTYTQTSPLAFGSGANFALQVVGFGTLHNDGGAKPLITTATNSTRLINLAATDLSTFRFDNISFSNTAAVRAAGMYAGGATDITGAVVISRSVFDGFTTAITSDSNAGGVLTMTVLTLNNTEIKNGTNGVSITNTTPGETRPASFACVACYIHDNTGNGIMNGNQASGQLFLSHSILANNANANIFLDFNNARGLTIDSSVFTGSQYGINITSEAFNLVLSNSIIYGNSVAGISVLIPSQSQATGQANAYGNNAGIDRNNFPVLPGDKTLTASPFVGGTNYALNTTAGGGAVCRNAGFPGVFPGATTTGTIDIGAVQSAAPTSTGCASACVQ